jgi:hypothetical protein
MIFILASRFSVVQKSQFSDWCDLAITLELENGAGSLSAHVHRKWILLVGGPDNQLIFSFRGNDSMLTTTTWSRTVRVSARCGILEPNFWKVFLCRDCVLMSLSLYD